jgi:hypothetical protein
MVDDFPGRYAEQAISDLTAHEHDLRHALGRPGRRDSRSIDVGLDFVLSMIVHPGMSALSLGPLAVKTANRQWVVGGGEANGEFDLEAMRQGVALGGPHVNSAEPVGSVSASDFELCRAFTGRRSANEVRGYDWSVDPDPYIAAFSLGPFSLRDSDLNE